ncbi:MAG: hypothetical protein KY460_01855 [Actinobacteria bacterium]|nr:hypothetical protein [Actinomycetota bacterium]
MAAKLVEWRGAGGVVVQVPRLAVVAADLGDRVGVGEHAVDDVHHACRIVSVECLVQPVGEVLRGGRVGLRHAGVVESVAPQERRRVTERFVAVSGRVERYGAEVVDQVDRDRDRRIAVMIVFHLTPYRVRYRL